MPIQYNDFVRLIPGSKVLESPTIDVDVEYGHGKEWGSKKNAMIEITKLGLTSLSCEYMYSSNLLDRSQATYRDTELHPPIYNVESMPKVSQSSNRHCTSKSQYLIISTQLPIKRSSPLKKSFQHYHHLARKLRIYIPKPSHPIPSTQQPSQTIIT